MRATLILLFLFTYLYALAGAAVLPVGGGYGLLRAGTLQLPLSLAPVMLGGISFGERAFAGVSPHAFRRQVLNLLVLTTALSVGRTPYR
jgi:hypothetical protein